MSLSRYRKAPHSLSPEQAAAASQYWTAARRLAAYPAGRLPDVNSLPVIDRYDWPAPPSPAVVMIDKRMLTEYPRYRSSRSAS
ncbi:unnamed protein product [Protopolystoma xenopodis]|uniref:Uncharacterized protein n=1 Tax=Protopolystoma xenopodis TaxID=117903 RepID=A0A3S5B0C2_9PLAT|nr:unnamed protein product [Protopolystoma xenopodis]